ncbi:hypothetical protein SCHPADRAFT_944790 [Schizopora paradoxa]|uniref:F-box domain-containing protein n=1 Tax=Schizopora paradoxa TaxID=27342 RepID=A0A0H2R9F0_9AGAM|nr:hypothetical protein SCHPADRAFT_944790 [Schizopora paradoxa]
MNADDVVSIANSMAKLYYAYPNLNRSLRELHLTYTDISLGHISYDLLKHMIKQPFEALEYLSICNDPSISDEDREDFELPIRMEPRDSDIICSWEMPKLTHLRLHNVYPQNPLKCENVTHFTFEVDRSDEEDLDITVFCRLLQSMPKIQALSIALNANVAFAIGPPARLALPCLESFQLRIGDETPSSTISEIISTISVQDIKHLSLQFSGSFNCDENLLERWIIALTPYANGELELEGEPELQFPFSRLENFTLEVVHFQGSNIPFGRLFQAMPNVRHVSLKLPGTADLVFDEDWKDADVNILRYLRTLRLASTQSSPNDFSCQLSGIEEFFSDGYCQDFERLEVQLRQPYHLVTSKARLFNFLGERLRWVEC